MKQGLLPHQILGAAQQPRYRSYAEFVAKAQAIREEHLEAQRYLAKARPALEKLLEIRLTKGWPLFVMRPLKYQTSITLNAKNGPMDEIDRSFYGGASSTENEVQKARTSNYVDYEATILPGTQLMLKSIDSALREFIFVDGAGREHAISFDQKESLMTQTDIFETVKKFLEGETNV